MLAVAIIIGGLAGLYCVHAVVFIYKCRKNTKADDEFTFDELKHLAASALFPEKIVVDNAIETVALFYEHWQKEKTNLPLYSNVVEAIDKHIDKVPIATKLG